MNETTAARRPDFDAVRPPDGEKPFIHLCWMLHNQCNHRCSYCSESNWGGSHKWLKLEHATRFAELALEHYSDRTMMVSFTGGEPTLWPDFGPFVEWLHSRGVIIGMTTNGTKPRAFFEQYAKYFDWISFSYHPEFTRHSRFLENIAESSKHSHVAARIMMPPDEKLWSRSNELISEAEAWNQDRKFASNVFAERVAISLDFGSAYPRPTKYSDQQNTTLASTRPDLDGADREIEAANPLNRIGFSYANSPTKLSPLDASNLLIKNSTKFLGWTCDIGLEQLFIDDRGMILRAGCRVGGVIGHISDEAFAFPTKPIRCVKNYCHCVTDILTSKRSQEWPSEKKEGRSLASKITYAQERAQHESAAIFYRIGQRKIRFERGLELSTLEKIEQNILRAFGLLNPKTAARSLGLIRYIRSTVIHIFWSRPIQKSYYFSRYQFYKRILGKTPPGTRPLS